MLKVNFMKTKLDFHPKFFSCIRNYSKSTFMSDLMAGTIVGIVALPLAIAFAIASGVSPEKGIVTAIIAGFIVSFLGGSKVQIGGPTGAFIVIVYGVIQQYGIGGLTVATIIAGVLLILLGVFKLGTVIKFIPYPVVVGFTSGIAVTIFTTQMADVFGLSFGGETVPGDFIGKWMLYFRHLDTINWWDAGVSILSVLIIMIVPKFSRRIPGSLVAIIFVTAGVYALKTCLGIEGIDTIGDRFTIASQLPKAEMPALDWEAVKNLFPIAVTIAALGAIESLLSATVADGMIHAGVLLLILLFLMPLAQYIPMACLAGVLVVVSYNMSGWRTFRALLKNPKSDVTVLLITFFLTVIFDLTVAIAVGLMLACVLFMRRVMETTEISAVKNEIKVQDESGIHTYDEGLTIPKGVEVYEINGPYFFGVATQFEELMSEFRDRSKVRIIRMRKVPFIDSTGIHNLSNLCELSHKNKITVILSGVNPKVHAALHKAGFYHLLGEKNICPNINVALERANEVLSA